MPHLVIDGVEGREVVLQHWPFLVVNLRLKNRLDLCTPETPGGRVRLGSTHHVRLQCFARCLLLVLGLFEGLRAYCGGDPSWMV
jgi:hypothetical protein